MNFNEQLRRIERKNVPHFFAFNWIYSFTKIFFKYNETHKQCKCTTSSHFSLFLPTKPFPHWFVEIRVEWVFFEFDIKFWFGFDFRRELEVELLVRTIFLIHVYLKTIFFRKWWISFKLINLFAKSYFGIESQQFIQKMQSIHLPSLNRKLKKLNLYKTQICFSMLSILIQRL